MVFYIPPFEGWELQTFEEVSLTPVSQARSIVVSSIVPFVNPVEIRFKPSSEIPARSKFLGLDFGGMIRVMGPQDMEFVPTNAVTRRLNRILKNTLDNLSVVID